MYGEIYILYNYIIMLEQEVRKQWLQEQETSHGYGNDDELDFEAQDDDVQGGSDLLSQTTVTGPDGASVVTSKKTCKCGSTKHLRTSHSDCPLWKDKQVSDTSNAENEVVSVVLLNIYVQAIMTVLLTNVSNNCVIQLYNFNMYT